MGLEPTTSGVTGQRSDQLNYEAVWCFRLDLNQQRAGLQPAALPVELPKQMAQQRGLEPPIPLWGTPAFQAGRLPIITLLHMATGVGAEPTRPEGLPVFETG